MSEHPSPSAVDFAQTTAAPSAASSASQPSPAVEPSPAIEPGSAVEPGIVELLALFAGPLSSVRFPDIDHATLSDLASAVELAQAEVEQARALLASSVAQLEARRLELHTRAQRAKAYARVYAEGNAGLQAELDRVVLPKPGPHVAPLARAADAEPRKRGRPRKVREPSSLFEAPSMLEATAAE